MILHQGEAMCNAKRFYAELLLVKLRYCWNSSRFVIGTKLHVGYLSSNICFGYAERIALGFFSGNYDWLFKNSDYFVKYLQTKSFSLFGLLITFPRICFVCGLLSEGWLPWLPWRKKTPLEHIGPTQIHHCFEAEVIK